MSRLRLIATGVVPFALTWPLLFRGAIEGDVTEFRGYGDQILSGHLPYRDFNVEYPPGALAFFALPSLGPDHLYLVLFQVLAAAGIVVGLVLLALLVERLELDRRQAYVTLVYAGLVPAMLGAFALQRFDMWPEALCVGALLLLVAGRPRAALILLAVGTVVKTYPVALVPVFLIYAGRRAWRGALLWYCLVGFVLLVPWAAIGHVGLYNSYATQWDRHLQLESMGSAILLALHRPVRIAFDAGAWSDFGAGAGPAAVLQTLLQAVGVLVPTYLFWRTARTPRDVVAASIAVLAGVAVLGKVLSPQFLLWVAPLLPLSGDWLATGLFTGALLTTNLLFPDRYAGLLAKRGGEIALLCVRNAFLVASVLALWRVLAQRTRIGGESSIRSPSWRSMWGPATRPTR
jgi:Glycosyltransferase family 87